jgi:cytochrome c peroxidase
MRIKIALFICASIGLAFKGSEVFSLVYPKYFPSPVYESADNPLTAEKVGLGRFLFYDPILSKDNSISCASCHSPYNAFAHTDHDLSHGINDSIGTRNAPALFNLAWQNSFMWDGAIHNLDMQALAPISHSKEMAESIENVIAKLNTSRLFRTAFYTAWQDSVATGEHVLKSLAQFQLSLISADAKYDKVQSGKEEFSHQEESGLEVFNQHCNSCHQAPLFSTYEFANNGLPVDSTLNDFGRYGITQNPQDSLKFKIPSLRNLSYTYPYMHDGRFNTLHEVVSHYNTLIGSETNDEHLNEPLNLTSKNKADLVAFLLTLNDETFVFNLENKYPSELLEANKK